jgi:hypothetical protein
MNGKLLFLALTLLFLLPHFGLAAPIEIQTEDTIFTAYIGELKEINISIINNQDFSDGISLSIWPTAYVDLQKYYVRLDPHSSATVKISIFPLTTAAIETKEYTITASSTTDPEVKTSQKILIKIDRRSGIYISDLSLEKESISPGEKIRLHCTITNLDPQPHENLILESVLKKNNIVIQRKRSTLRVISPHSAETITTIFGTTKYTESGNYIITSTLRDSLNRFIDTKTTNLKILEVHNLVKSKKVDYGLLFHTVTIILKNEGNVEEKNVYLTEYIPKLLDNFFFPETEPDYKKVIDNRVVYKWHFAALRPGEERKIIYQLRFANVFLAAIIVILLTIVGVRHKLTPALEKTFKIKKIKGKKEIRIVLHVKNRSRKTIKNVKIKDFVPPIVSVVKEFEGLKPTIKVRENGTEIHWKIEALKPREERVLTYRIKPVVEIIGKFKLPKATMTYQTTKGKKKKTISKSIKVATVVEKEF